MTTVEAPSSFGGQSFEERGIAYLNRAVNRIVHAPTEKLTLPLPIQGEVVQDKTWTRRTLERGRAALRAVNIFNRFKAVESAPIATAMQMPTAILKDPSTIETLGDVPAEQSDVSEPVYDADPAVARQQRVKWLYENPPSEELPLTRRIHPRVRNLGSPEPEDNGTPEQPDDKDKKQDSEEPGNSDSKFKVTGPPRLSLVPPPTEVFATLGTEERSAMFENFRSRGNIGTSEQPKTVADIDDRPTNVISQLPVDPTIELSGQGVYGEMAESFPTDWAGLAFNFGSSEDADLDADIIPFPALNDTDELPIFAPVYEGPDKMDPDAALQQYQEASRNTGVFYPEGFSIFERTRQDLTDAEILEAPDVVKFIKTIKDPAIADPSSNPIRDNYDKGAAFPHKLGVFDQLSREMGLFDHEPREIAKVLEPINPKMEDWDAKKYVDLTADYTSQFEFAVETASEAHVGGVLNNLLDSAEQFTAHPLEVSGDLLSTPQKAAMGIVYGWSAAEFVEENAAKLGNARAGQRAREIRDGFTPAVYANIVNHALPGTFINRRSKHEDLGYADATPQELTNLYVVSTQMRNYNPNLRRGVAERAYSDLVFALQKNIEAVPEAMRAGVLVEYASRQAA